MAMTLMHAIHTLGDNATVEKIGPLVNIPAKSLDQEVLQYGTRGWITTDEKGRLSITALGKSMMERGLL